MEQSPKPLLISELITLLQENLDHLGDLPVQFADTSPCACAFPVGTMYGPSALILTDVE